MARSVKLNKRRDSFDQPWRGRGISLNVGALRIDDASLRSGYCARKDNDKNTDNSGRGSLTESADRAKTADGRRQTACRGVMDASRWRNEEEGRRENNQAKKGLLAVSLYTLFCIIIIIIII